MKRSSLLKGTIAIFFFSSIIFFVAFRSGKLDDYFYSDNIQTSPNGGPLSNQLTDTIPKKTDTIPAVPDSISRIHMMSGSKSGMIVTPEMISDANKAPKDSVRRFGVPDTTRLRMYSSKSAMVIDPNHPAFRKKKKQKKNKNQ